MATTPQYVNGDGAIPEPEEMASIQEVLVEYDATTRGVTVTPGIVDKEALVRFVAPTGTKLRISFLIPMGEETKSILDSDVCMLKVGGVFHFKCYFTFPGQEREFSPENGGVIDVRPHLP